MEPYVIWFIAAGVLVVTELISGTFYLLMIALGAAAGGFSSAAGLPMMGQFLSAATVAVAGILALRQRGWWSHRGGEKSTIAFDAGQPVEVIERHADGSLRVFYRGTHWDAELAPEASKSGDALSYVIKTMRGSRLVLTTRG